MEGGGAYLPAGQIATWGDTSPPPKKQTIYRKLSYKNMKRFISFDIIFIGSRNINNSNKFGTASRADVDDEFVEILHDKIESHAGAALFLFDLIFAHGKATHEVSANFFGGEGTEPVVYGNDELSAVAGKREETGFVGLQIDGNGAGTASIGADAVGIDGRIIDGVHQQFVGHAGDCRNDAFVDSDVGGIFGHRVQEGIFLQTRRHFIRRGGCAITKIFIDAENIISYNFAHGDDEFFGREIVGFGDDVAGKGESEDIAHFLSVPAFGQEEDARASGDPVRGGEL